MVLNWSVGMPAAFDLSGVTRATEKRKHEANDAKCRELGWVCVPMFVEAYGAWGVETMEYMSRLAACLATNSIKARGQLSSPIFMAG